MMLNKILTDFEGSASRLLCYVITDWENYGWHIFFFETFDMCKYAQILTS